MTRGLRLPSGRVIAIGRYMLASLFLLAIWMDVTQPANAPVLTWAVLGSYVVFAVVVLGVTWNNWWLDARLAGAVHSIDIAVYTFLVFSTEGYTSPFSTAFMFILLAAAIRWGWRATALTAVLLTLLYLLAGLGVAATSTKFVLQPFVIRTGQLVILSLILMWFGVNQWRFGVYSRDKQGFGEPSLYKSSLENSLEAAMHGLNAPREILVWREHGSDKVEALIAEGSQLTAPELKADFVHKTSRTPLSLRLLQRSRPDPRSRAQLAPLPGPRVNPQGCRGCALIARWDRDPRQHRGRRR